MAQGRHEIEGYIPRGTAGDGEFELNVQPERAGWQFSGLRVASLAPGASIAFDSGDAELLVLPLAGGCEVRVDGERFQLTGREHVFAGTTDFVYAPPGARIELSSAHGGRFAVPSARAEHGAPARAVAAADVPVELRGAGAMSRRVHNFCSPEAFDAERLIAVEVYTPGGNWSSYPPHKHDEVAGEQELPLEEIFYYEVAAGPAGPGFGAQCYDDGQRAGDGLACVEVRSGDVVLIPRGYHGPSMAAPGYELYYLNVMAGPAQRLWRIRDDPAHAWIRGTWAEEPLDPRLLAPGATTR